MVTQNTTPTWEEAQRSFFLHKRAVRSLSTAMWYRNYVGNLVNWANEQNLDLDQFTKRHLDAYLASRADRGIKPTTLHHDALAACVFFEWCKRNDLIDRDPLVEYKVRTAPVPPKYMPSEEDVQRLLEAILEFYDNAKNPSSARGHSARNRSFHRERNYTLELAKLDTACRIGELINLKVSDWQADQRQLTIREAKGREPRVLPVSDTLAQALTDWLRVRARIMSQLPAERDEGWLFIGETGGQVDYHAYLRAVKKIVRWARLPNEIANHSQRRFSLNRSAKKGGLLFAQGMAGHKDPKTTMIYLKIDGDYLRETHSRVNVLGDLLTSKRAIKKKRLV